MVEYDVVIAGAGPSGAAAAKGLVNEGLKVLVIEKKKLPRYKMCSGIIFKKSQDITEKYFGKIPNSAYVAPNFLKGVRFWSHDEQYTDWPFSKDGSGAPNVWRSEYDYWLINNSGAEVWDCYCLKGFQDSGNHITAECYNTSHGKTKLITCRYLISAEGSRSIIRAALDPEFEKGVKWFVAYQNYYEGNSDLDPCFYHGFLDAQYGDVYSWFNVKDGLQIFGTAVKRGVKMYPYLSKYTEMLEKRFGLKLKNMVRKAGCLGNDMCTTGRFYLGKGNVLLVGEAGGFLNAFGEGISCALSTGLFAAEAVSKSIKSGMNALATYTDLTRLERRQTTVSWKLGAKIAGRNLMPL
ncbi:MAG: NAD(P)/FAD-dependent oxidoreductase [Candidatus Brocadia sinica]|nr:NAD(P)/FAD-dependent oxidoreductase [Candidatus Brocadia sinica]NUO04776.1 NAD(P)/FAD-dependent oxidoreductase [Candidatus Brocadia sinica]